MTPVELGAPRVPGYRLTCLLGEGGASRVWRARRESDDALVAVKVVPDVATSDGTLDDVALHEWTLLQHVASEHVVGLHEVLELGGDDTGDGPALALVLDLLSGGSLGRVVAQRGHLSAGETVTVMAPVATAVDRLHELGVVHGDVSPGNVLLDSTGRPVLADLGVARLVGAAPSDVHGTDGFVAPEVLLGEEPCRASDVYALGSLAWLCLSGAPPGHVADRRDLAEAAPHAPDGLVDLVQQCLAPDPEQRPDAEDAALAFYDAAPAEALRLVSPGDVSSGLTRRIREAARDADDADLPWHRLALEDPDEGWWRRRRERRATRRRERDAAALAEASLPEAGRHRDLEPAPPRGRWVGALVGAAAVGVGVALVAPSMGGDAGAETVRLTPTTATTRTPATTAPSPVDTAVADRSSTDSTPSDDPDAGEAMLRRLDAPRRDPQAVVEALVDVRRAMLTGDPDALHRLDVPGSAAARADAEHLEELAAKGESYRGVDLAVRHATTREVTPTTVVVRTRVDEGGYAVETSDGSLRQHAARDGETVDLVLRHGDGRWRISDVRGVS